MEDKVNFNSHLCKHTKNKETESQTKLRSEEIIAWCVHPTESLKSTQWDEQFRDGALIENLSF